MTPIIAGSICGGLLFISWTIGFVVYFRKRWNRKKRNRLIAAGKAAPREKDLQPLQQNIVIPPDPAVLLGQRKAGEVAFPERQHSKDACGHGKIPQWSRHTSHTKHPDDPSSDSSKGKAPQRNGYVPVSHSEEPRDHHNAVDEFMTAPSHP